MLIIGHFCRKRNKIARISEARGGNSIRILNSNVLQCIYYVCIKCMS